MRFLNKRGLLLACLSLFTLTLPVFAEPAPKPLFNGRDLTGWVVMHAGEWTVEGGVLTGRNGTNWTTNPEHSGSWLRTEKPYGDFELELDYAINAKGNSGILFRSALEKNPSFTGYEMQILDDAGREPKKFTTGALYDVVPASRNMSKPAGEWNHVKIHCEGKRIKVNLNGVDVVDFDGERSPQGYIGLQNHDTNAVVRFRNIRLTEK